MARLINGGNEYGWIDGQWQATTNGVNRTAYVDRCILGPKGYTNDPKGKGNKGKSGGKGKDDMKGKGNKDDMKGKGKGKDNADDDMKGNAD